jgi:xanthine dehydrogenase small subunit
MRQHLNIFVNGQRHEIAGARALQTLTDFLRRELRLAGTKVVCAEGDCGSCTVLVGRPRGDGKIAYQTVCGCIQSLGQLDGTHVVTVEGLLHDGQLNSWQESMIRCHGAQCGYCTPGFVVQTYAMLQDGRPHDNDQIVRGLTGNLCRCTGYEPILRAAAETDVSRLRRIDELFPPATLAPQLEQAAAESVLIVDGERSFFKPITLEQAVEFRAGNPACAIVAGGTDLSVQINKRISRPDVVMSLLGVGELRVIAQRDGALEVGATATLTELQRAVEPIPAFVDWLELFGSPMIRNAGTLAGNIANGSPIGDMLPPLFVLDATVELASAAGRRTVNVNDFYTGYRQTVMRPDELIAKVIVPLPRDGEVFKLYKVSKRKDLDISTFSAAIRMRLGDGDEIDEIRISFGGIGPTVVRLRKTEAALRGRVLDEAALADVEPIVQAEISTISDVRGSAEYRRLMARNVLRRFVTEVAAVPT